MKHRANKIFVYIISVIAVIFLCNACILPSSLPSPEAPPVSPPPSEKDTQITVVSSTSSGTVADGWKEVALFEGKESAITEPFTVSKRDWRIIWELDTASTEHSFFSLFLYRDNERDGYIKKVSYYGGGARDTCYIEESNGNYYIKVIAANLTGWTASIEEREAEPSPSDVQIVHIRYEGRNLFESLKLGFDSIEADEYVEIRNTGDKPQNINGWKLKNVSKGLPTFTFSKNNTQQINDWFASNIAGGKPSFPLPGHSPFSNTQEMDKFLAESSSSGGIYTSFSPNILAPHTAIRVYTGEFHPESGGFSFYYLPGDIWDNDKADVAVLYDSSGTEISRRSYVIP
jgi:hypothetical protein